jgi:hypothetical protein
MKDDEREQQTLLNGNLSIVKWREAAKLYGGHTSAWTF